MSKKLFLLIIILCQCNLPCLISRDHAKDLSFSGYSALSPRISLEQKRLKKAWQKLSKAKKRNKQVLFDDKNSILILGERYPLSARAAGNMQRIFPAQEKDLGRIVDLFGRLRDIDAMGFDPGDRFAEEQSFLGMIRGEPDMKTATKTVYSHLLVFRDKNDVAQGYARAQYYIRGDIVDVYIAEIVVSPDYEGKEIAKALSFKILREIENKFGGKFGKFNLHGISGNKKIYADNGLAAKIGFTRMEEPGAGSSGVRLYKEIKLPKKRPAHFRSVEQAI